MHGNDIGMIEAGLQLNLAQESQALLLGIGSLDFQDFQRFGPFGNAMTGFEDRTDSSASHQSDDGIVADGLSGCEAHGSALSNLARLVRRSFARFLRAIRLEAYQHDRDIVWSPGFQ